MKTKERVNRTVLSVRVKPEIKKFAILTARLRKITTSRYVESALEAVREMMAGKG